MTLINVAGPTYVAHSNWAVTSAEGPRDLLQVLTPADCIIIPIYAWVGYSEAPLASPEEQAGFSLGTFTTPGSGAEFGNTLDKFNQHLQDSQCTVTAVNATDASGTERNFARRGTSILGYGWRWRGQGDLIVPVSTSLVLRLETTLAANREMIFGIKWMELGQ